MRGQPGVRENLRQLTTSRLVALLRRLSGFPSHFLTFPFVAFSLLWPQVLTVVCSAFERAARVWKAWRREGDGHRLAGEGEVLRIRLTEGMGQRWVANSGHVLDAGKLEGTRTHKQPASV